MTWTIVSYAIGVLALGVYCLLVLPTAGWRRVAAPLVLIALYVDLLWCGFQALGHPKPAWVELPGETEARLIAYQFREGEAIYLWLQVPWTPEPIAYQLPWREGEAAAVYKADHEAKAAGNTVIVQGVLGHRHDGEFKAYPAPVQPLPPKS